MNLEALSLMTRGALWSLTYIPRLRLRPISCGLADSLKLGVQRRALTEALTDSDLLWLQLINHGSQSITILDTLQEAARARICFTISLGLLR